MTRQTYAFVLRDVTNVVTWALADILYLVEDKKHSGGFFSLFENSPDIAYGLPPVLTCQIGNVGNDPIKLQQYHTLSMEKPRRLYSNPDHLGSFQSRNPEKSKWGGAICTDDWLMGFSGQSELADEATMLLSAVRLGWLDIPTAVLIASASQNSLFKHRTFIVNREATEMRVSL